MDTNKGFTLIELLASVVIMGVLLTVVLAPLTQLFRSTGDSGQALRVTTQAQELTEHVRGQWQSYPEDLDTSGVDKNLLAREQSRKRYDKTCSAVLPVQSGITKTVRVVALDTSANEVGTLTFSEDCASAVSTSNPPPIKRLTVTTTTPSGGRSSLTLDIPRP